MAGNRLKSFTLFNHSAYNKPPEHYLKGTRMQIITKEQFQKVSQGRFVTITSTKKNGDIQKVNGQIVSNPPSLKGRTFLTTVQLPARGIKGKKSFKVVNLLKTHRIAMDGKVLQIK